MNKELSGGDKFIIMCDIEKRAKALTIELKEKGGLIAGDSLDGYKYIGKDKKEAEDCGFERTADKKWVGFVNHGDGAYSERAYAQTLREYKEKLPNSFLDHVYQYEYLL